jgi:hypothetical protein
MIEDGLFLEYKEYMLERTKFKDMLIVPMTPKSIVKFPTIVMAEINNSDNAIGKTTDRIESVSRLSYRVSAFTKPIIVDGTKYQERQVMNEIKELTYEFFNQVGFNRSSSRRTDNLDTSILRQEMIFTGNLASWNNSLYF